jgi:hypothetical protein
MNTKVNIRFNLKMVEYFNEQLAIENSVTERLVTRIHEVSFPNFKQHLEKNLRETMGRKEMIYQLIVSLGGKPTDTKSTLPTLKMPDSHSIRELKDSVESFTNHRRKEAKLAASLRIAPCIPIMSNNIAKPNPPKIVSQK